jgi:hypothetical protein
MKIIINLELSPPPQKEIAGELDRGSYRNRSPRGESWEAAGGI